jgi:hypothetical protein
MVMTVATTVPGKKLIIVVGAHTLKVQVPSKAGIQAS